MATGAKAIGSTYKYDLSYWRVCDPPQCPDLQLLVGVVVDQLLVITVVAAESFKLVAGHVSMFSQLVGCDVFQFNKIVSRRDVITDL